MPRIQKILGEKISEIFERKNEGMVSSGRTVDNQTKLIAICADIVCESTLPKIEEHRVESRINNIMTLLKYRPMVRDI